MSVDGKVPFKTCNVLLDVNGVPDVSGVDAEPPLRKCFLMTKLLMFMLTLSLFFVGGNIFDVVLLLDVVDFVVAIFTLA